MKEGRFKVGEGGQAKRSSLGEVEGSPRDEWTQRLSRTICRALVSLQDWSNLKWERRLEDKKSVHKMTKPNESR